MQVNIKTRCTLPIFFLILIAAINNNKNKKKRFDDRDFFMAHIAAIIGIYRESPANLFIYRENQWQMFNSNQCSTAIVLSFPRKYVLQYRLQEGYIYLMLL